MTTSAGRGDRQGCLGFWEQLAVVSLGMLVVMLLSSCGAPQGYGRIAPAPSPVMAEGGAEARRAADVASAPVERPGIATGWGREVSSRMSYTTFTRASGKPYGGVAMIRYNDRQGIEAMTGWTSRAGTMQEAAGGLVEWGVKGMGGSLKSYGSGGGRFVEGKEGQRYMLVVKNKAKSRLEVVLSVDGLDVMDGKAASVRKRGYIIAPGKTLEVKGWRKSQAAVASFRFSGVGSSYASLKHGDTRNVGVIGLAVFTEKGVDPFTWMPAEVKRRGGASPFAEAPIGAR